MAVNPDIYYLSQAIGEEKSRKAVRQLEQLMKAAFDRISSIEGTSSIFRGAGSPESKVTATIGSLYLRTDGGANTTLYVKESGTGNTGWAAK